MKKKHPLHDLDGDIRDHIEREIEKNSERGMAPEEARYAALRKFDLGATRNSAFADSKSADRPPSRIML